MNYRLDYINALGLKLSLQQITQLELLLNLVWDKKDMLNLTSVQDKQEIWDRHILDGLTAAPLIGDSVLSIADCGAGAGYIGLSLKIVLPKATVSLIESLERRCAFMQWAIFKLGLKDIQVINTRLGSGLVNTKFDIVTERAMGKIDDILPLCAGILNPQGSFIAYQADDSFCMPQIMQKNNIQQAALTQYTLPSEAKKRKLVVFKWI